MQDITLSITHTTEYEQLLRGLQGGKTPALAVGLPPVSKAQLAAALHLETGRPVLLLTDDEGAVRRLADDLETFAEKHVLRVPERDFVMLGVESSSRQYEQARISALWHLAEGAPLAAGSVAALSQTCIPPQVLRDATFTLTEGENKPLAEITAALTAAGYQRCVQVEGAGQFAVRGGILDLFPPQEAAPVRVEFWGDDIDSMAYFDVGSQRRGARVETLTCLPCAETLPGMAKGGVAGLCAQLTGILKARRKKQHPDLEQNLTRDIERLRETGTLPAADKYLPLIYPQSATAFDYLPADTLILVDDTPRLREASKGFSMRITSDIEALTERGELPPSEGYALSFAQLVETLRRFACVRMDTFLNSVPELAPQTLVNFVVTQMNAYGGSLDMAAADIASYIRQGRAVAVLCASEMRCRSMYEALDLHDVPARLSPKLPPKGRVHIMEGSLSAGFELPTLDLTVITEGQIIARRARSKSRAKKTNRDRVKSYTDLTPGDLVVHEHHGIGRFVGMESITVDGSVRDFVKIAFAGTDFLYVPATSLDLISKYIGGGEPEKTRLSKLGGADWAKARTRAKAAAKQLAEGLLKLYAERAKLKGFAFPADDAWQQEFEESFPYDETDDQLRCVAEIKADMESDRPMDRLLCGDVGFGKTEVALRAVMKCILAGKQAAILVPTTVLARQHFLTAKSRFSGYPLRIELLSRYKTASEQKKILEQLKTGMIDLIIGTHKLFNKKIEFHDLGLLVIDEEQRFGVSHKETLKEMSKQVDVLTLSATPIPRTLNMALSGIRDMSAIEEPPHDRHPVQTYVLEYNEPLVLDAIRRELARGGQVYYLHNIVESIERTAARLQKQLPDARIAVAHGKMTQRELTSAMTQMADGEIDILVCTTIIETGIDIPNANTLIIENADTMGLAQLHQIRGRVGRSSRRAFAYLTYRRGRVLSEIAQKRLSAVREFAEFGSGFKIAMRDLEIRGAGNVLGPEQSGHMMSVGYDLYLKLLEEAVMEEKGETPPQRVECAADLTLSANLPATYVSDPGQRVDLYRRIALIRSEDARSDILDELIDRYGEPPKEAIALLDIALLRAEASAAGVTEIKQQDGRLLLTFQNADFQRLSILCGDTDYKGRLLLNAGSQPYVSLRLKSGETPLSMARTLVEKYAATAS
ncbi:MAG: transcription-repair coupling factor [Clostridiaceae bacterium]|nr:transcription-repair coupling factor [Clostridiaceae bacterium]